MGSLPPLRKYSIRGASSRDAFTSMLAKQFPDYVIELGPGAKEIRAQIGFCPLDRIQLFYGRYQSPFRFRARDSRSFMQSFPLRGSGEAVCNGIAMMSSASKGALAEPGAISFAPAPIYEDLVTSIDPEALLKTLSTLVGAPAVRRLRLELSNFETRPEARLSRGLVKLLVEELDADHSTPSPVVLAELEQAILVAFLFGNRHNYSDLLGGRPPGAAPWQVRRVEEYIEANWDQPITIEALAVVANASARSIFHSFKEHRRYSPMNFVKNVRLKHAREMLSARAHEMSVTSVAFACGFGNLGHFASDYKRAFGEMPSATQLRAKGGARC